MRNFFETKINIVLTVILIILAIIIAVQAILPRVATKADEGTYDTANSARVNPKYETILATEESTVAQTTEKTEPSTQKPTQKATAKKAAETTRSTKSTKATKASTTAKKVVWATAIPPKGSVDYKSQWNAGYLVAIDNPDKTYACGQVTLSDYDRDLLERLCMGEFGSGGFVGASLIAQAVKNAMCFDGYRSVQSVIDNCHYTGSTKIAANNSCKQAVQYIFDQNHDAVQHRLMYMYNPELVESSFHESQNYILTYQSVRFFDRWGY